MLLHSDRNFVARATDVIQSHGNRSARCDAARHPDVDLIQSRESRRIAKPQDLGQVPADCDLRRNHASIRQAGAVDDQRLAGNSGVARRDKLIRGSMLDRALSSPVTRKREQCGRRRQHRRAIQFGAVQDYGMQADE